MDNFHRHLDHVGAKPKLFNCILSFFNSKHVFLLFWAPGVWTFRFSPTTPSVYRKVQCILNYPLARMYASHCVPSRGAMGTRRKKISLIFHGNFACFLPNKDPNSSLVCFLEIHWRKMVIMWHEIWHEEEDMVTIHDLGTVTVLRNCGSLKFFRISSMSSSMHGILPTKCLR